MVDALAQEQDSFHMVAQLGYSNCRDGRHSRPVHGGNQAASLSSSNSAATAAATAVSGRRGVLADVIAPSESGEDRNVGDGSGR